MKTGKKIVFAIIGIVLLALFYYFPLQRAMAEIKFWSYAKEAGIQKTDISERKVFKDYVQDGYYMETVYESDPEHTYNYHYYLIDHRNDGLGFHRMYYTVFDATNTQCGYYLPFDPPEQGE